jgi:hypothetical protein
MTKLLFTLFFLINVTVFSQVKSPLVKIWETDTIYSGAESVAYDPKRDVLYVSNYTEGVKNGGSYGDHTISKVSSKGKLITLKWITNLTTPTGICVFNDNLYIVERFGVVVYDLGKNKIATKYYIKTPDFINDVSVAKDSSIYVSVSNNDIIYRIKNRVVEEWLNSKEISRPNGILCDNDLLIVGANADSTLRAVNFSTKKVTTVAQLKKGVIDGIKKYKDGYLVSFFEGNLFEVKNSGEVIELINTRAAKINIADFEYIESKKQVIAPSLRTNKLVAFQLPN